MDQKTVRSLERLQETASTARVLNLLRIDRLNRRNPDHSASPFFENETLNKSIVLKHRVRRDEAELFPDRRRLATKIIVPIDVNDLRFGGRTIFVGQSNFEQVMHAAFGESWGQNLADREMLEILDSLPSLDPFLLRERLRSEGRAPARCYFEVSDADMQRMISFVEREIRKLVDLCFAGSSSDNHKAGARLVEKILSITVDAETEPLRLTLRLERDEYQDGVFCWKGFLYYKWTLHDALPAAKRVAEAVATIRPRGDSSLETRSYLERTRGLLADQLKELCNSATASLKVYDDAFDSLVDGQPQAFREFLLSAPSMFNALGERLGALNHIVSFWKYRFPDGKMPVVTPDELLDIFNDFEGSLAFSDAPLAKSAA